MSGTEVTGIAYCWGIGVPGVAHSLNTEDILVRLQAHGVRMHVITPPMLGAGRPSELAASFVRCPSFSGIAAGARTDREGPRKIAFGAPNGSWLSPLARLEAAVIRPEPMLPWAWPAARMGVRVGREIGARFVWATYPVMTACIAGAMHARRTGLPLIIRMGDPFTGPTRGRLHAVRARMERFACGSAHTLLAYTERMAAHLAGLYATPGGVLLTPGGFDLPPKAPRPATTGPVTLRHIGLLYANRRPREVLEAVGLVLARRPDLVSRLRVEFIGPLHDEIRDTDAYTRHSLPPSVVAFRGPVPREEAGRLAREADVLLLVQHDDVLADWTIPRKVYDYMSAGPPILGVVRNPELVALLRATGHHAFTHAEVERMSELIERAADGHLPWPAADPTYRAALADHTWDALIPKLRAAVARAAGEIASEEVKPTDAGA
jgi:hypothetical protein